MSSSAAWASDGVLLSICSTSAPVLFSAAIRGSCCARSKELVIIREAHLSEIQEAAANFIEWQHLL